MHERLEALKPLLKAGDYDKAAEALKSYREEFPDDWDGKLMEGIVAKLRGDEETFHRIHDEVQAVIDGHGNDAAQIKASSLWKKYHKTWDNLMKTVIIWLVMAGVTVTDAALLNRAVNNRIRWAWKIIKVGKPAADAWLKEQNHPEPIDLYDAPEDFGRD